MRNLKPIYIVLGGSVITLLITLLILIITHSFQEIPIPFILGIPIVVGLTTFLTFYFFIKLFITDKLKILYRSIRTGKFSPQTTNKYSLQDDVIEQAEIETKEWTKKQLETISKLEEQEVFRREFLGNLAHELKTPVFSIQGYILTLLEGGLEDESVNRLFLDRASKATERMTAMLNDLDQIIAMEVNAIKLDLVKFDVVELVEDLFEDAKVRSTNKNITLQFAKEFNPIWVRADKIKISQVISNLLNNSISYGNKNGTTNVRFYLMDNIVTIEVSDNGPGITEEHLPRLFERFYRVEKSRNRNQGGSGLGLSIAKHIIELHGQTINVRSTVGIGSTFTFSLNKAKR
ncbi:MAG: ATP-binding protein [Crocinitomicaceae bacterium]|nr:ATP-binding protein [Crocinitomicaceae bacterium]MDG1777136.1 ATP-binding protein [Crocinitomicaceae bacterium]